MGKKNRGREGGEINVISLLFQATRIIEMTAFLQTRLVDSLKFETLFMFHSLKVCVDGFTNHHVMDL